MTLSFLVKKIVSLSLSILISFYLVFLIIYASKSNIISKNVRFQGIKLSNEQEFSFKKATKEYFSWLKKIKNFSFGESEFFGENVNVILKERLKNTFILNLFALFILFFWGVVLGAISAVSKNKYVSIIEILFFVIYAIPDFILAIFLILIFSIKLNIFPSSGLVSLNHESLTSLGRFLDYIKHLFLPAMSLSLASIIFLARFTKNSIVGILEYSHIVALKVRGVDTFLNKVKHVLKNAVYPFISLFTFIIPGLVGGSIIIETIFGYPGIGKVLFTAIKYRDFPLLIAVSFINVVVVYFSIFLTDLLYEVFKVGEVNEKSN